MLQMKVILHSRVPKSPMEKRNLSDLRAISKYEVMLIITKLTSEACLHTRVLSIIYDTYVLYVRSSSSVWW